MRLKSLILFALFSTMAVTVWGQDAEGDSAEKMKANPNDATAINAYVNEHFNKIVELTSSDPDAAQKKVDEVRAVFESLVPEEAAAKQLVARYTSILKMFEQRIELARVSMEDVKATLEKDPTDVKAIAQFGAKISEELGPIARSEPDTAEAKLNSAKEFLAGVRGKAQDNEEVGKAIDNVERSLERMEQTILAAKKLLALIGKDAAPLQADAWVNGSPLTDADIKGKVVLLDFWAVWCGPCVATFPHLREWQDKYADKGLVIVGVTRYYNYSWDEEAGRANRSQEKMTEEAEREMLVKFAEHHNLHHRFALQPEGTLADFYGVTGIPQAVVIDQSGKIRLIKVGSGDANAKAIDDLLKELLEEKA